MQVTNTACEAKLTPILRQAFRPFFLFGAVFSVLGMALWGFALAGKLQLDFYHNVMFWHQHEMLFGFVAAIIVGFLLTAAQNWTGLRATHGGSLLLLVLVWLAGRLLFLLGGSLPVWLVAVVDLAFIPLATAFFANLVLEAGNKRNLFLVPVLLLLAIANAIMHAGVHFNQFVFIQYGSMVAIWVITLVMVVISGRVLPMFTANGTGTEKIPRHPGLEILALGSVWLILLLELFNLTQFVPDVVMALLFGVSALVLTWRWLRVRPWLTWRVPLLWSLHVAVACIPLGMGLFAARYAGLDVGLSTAIHALTAGAMGIMILAMMARVALGHSGRPLTPHPLMSAAFLLVILGALARIFAGWALPGPVSSWYHFAIGAWVLAYGLFVVLYWRILTTPRVDGRPG